LQRESISGLTISKLEYLMGGELFISIAGRLIPLLRTFGGGQKLGVLVLEVLVVVLVVVVVAVALVALVMVLVVVLHMNIWMMEIWGCG
jgi:hypothetical protein